MKKALKSLGGFGIICLFSGGAVVYSYIAFRLTDYYFYRP